jgi:hypothetical protein
MGQPPSLKIPLGVGKEHKEFTTPFIYFICENAVQGTKNHISVTVTFGQENKKKLKVFDKFIDTAK